MSLENGLIATLSEIAHTKSFGTAFFYSIYGLNDILSAVFFAYAYTVALKKKQRTQ